MLRAVMVFAALSRRFEASPSKRQSRAIGSGATLAVTIRECPPFPDGHIFDIARVRAQSVHADQLFSNPHRDAGLARRRMEGDLHGSDRYGALAIAAAASTG